MRGRAPRSLGLQYEAIDPITHLGEPLSDVPLPDEQSGRAYFLASGLAPFFLSCFGFIDFLSFF